MSILHAFVKDKISKWATTVHPGHVVSSIFVDSLRDISEGLDGEEAT
jgi:hypothetical protein